MYRHFAVLTLSLTGLVAFFANGENQDAAAQAAPPPAAAPVKAPEAKPQPEAEPADSDVGSWGPDIEIEHAANSVAYDGGWTPDLGPWRPDLSPSDSESQATARLTPAEREELARQMARQAVASAARPNA
jgi:hypothetical protein